MDLNNLTIIIVTYKSENKIYSCLDSIPSDVKTYVIENSSNNEFKKKIENKYSNVTCELVGENKGYAIANNIGLKKVSTKFSLVLNPDTKLEKDTIKNFFISLDKLKDFWLIGPGNGQSDKFQNDTNNIKEVKNLKGFAIFFNMKKFNQNFFDENFFLYFEEIDPCKKVLNSGGKIFINRDIFIHHDGAGSVEKDQTRELEKNRNWHWMWSTFYFHKKYKGFITALIIIFPKFFSAIFKFVYYSITMNSNKKDIYFCRMSGIFNSILGKKSWYRPSLD